MLFDSRSKNMWPPSSHNSATFQYDKLSEVLRLLLTLAGDGVVLTVTCMMQISNIVNLHDVSNIWHIPLLLRV
jgi:hypothetical protein